MLSVNSVGQLYYFQICSVHTLNLDQCNKYGLAKLNIKTLRWQDIITHEIILKDTHSIVIVTSIKSELFINWYACISVSE